MALTSKSEPVPIIGSGFTENDEAISEREVGDMNWVKVNGQCINLDNVSMVYQRSDGTIGIGWTSETPDNSLDATPETAAFFTWLESACIWNGDLQPAAPAQDEHPYLAGDTVMMTKHLIQTEDDEVIEATLEHDPFDYLLIRGDMVTVIGFSSQNNMIQVHSDVWDRAVWIKQEWIKKVQS